MVSGKVKIDDLLKRCTGCRGVIDALGDGSHVPTSYKGRGPLLVTASTASSTADSRCSAQSYDVFIKSASVLLYD